MTTTSVFSSSIDALTRPSLSLSLSLFPNTNRRSTRTKRSFCENSSGKKKAESFRFRSSKRRRGVKTHSIFLQAAGDDSVSDPDWKRHHLIAIYVLFLFGALHESVSPKPKDIIFRKTHRISSSSSSSSSDRDRRTKHTTVTPRTRSTRSGSKA